MKGSLNRVNNRYSLLFLTCMVIFQGCCKANSTLSSPEFTCPEGQYKVEIPGKEPRCYHCRHLCKTCTEYETCTSCVEHYDLDDKKQCVLSSCPKGQFLEISKYDNRTCIDCDESCSECTSLTECQDCKQYFSLTSQGKCIRTSCPDGQYLVTDKYKSSNSCKDCPENCKTCKSDTVCLSCEKYYGLVPSYQGCYRTSCPKGEYLQQSTSKDPSRNRCNSCPYNCKSCTDYKSCTECSSIYTLKNGECSYKGTDIWSLLLIIFGSVFGVIIFVAVIIACIDGKFNGCWKKLTQGSKDSDNDLLAQSLAGEVEEESDRGLDFGLGSQKADKENAKNIYPEDPNKKNVYEAFPVSYTPPPFKEINKDDK